MALEDLTPSNRIEEILNGDDITPSNRLEYFMAKAAEPSPAELPEVTAADAGKVLTVDSEGAWTADDVPEELPTVTSADAGKVLAVNSEGAWGAAAASGGMDIGFISSVPLTAEELASLSVGKFYYFTNTVSEAGLRGCLVYIHGEGSNTYFATVGCYLRQDAFTNSMVYHVYSYFTINKTYGTIVDRTDKEQISTPPKPSSAQKGKCLVGANNGWNFNGIPLPELPSDSADGTYTLKATMASGTITYSWVLDS